jgi:hypothetical protein
LPGAVFVGWSFAGASDTMTPIGQNRTHTTQSMDSLLSGLFDEVTKFFGRVVLWVVSLGRWRGERSREDEAAIHSAAGSIWFKREGQVVFTDSGLLFIGLGFYCACFLGLLFWFH